MAEDQGIERSELLALTAEIVAAHVGNNAVAGTDLGGLIQSVFDTLRGLSSNEPAVSVELFRCCIPALDSTGPCGLLQGPAESTPGWR